MNNPIYKRIRAVLCEFSTVGDLDEYAAFVTREVYIARERYARRKEQAA